MPSPLDELVQLFSVPPQEVEEYLLGVKAVTLRIPMERIFWIDALAEHAQLSRNGMLAHLVKVGLSEVLGALPDVIRSEVEASVASRAEGEV